MTFPQVITVAQLARAIGWRTERLRRRLKSGNALKRRGHLYYTTQERLVMAMPEVLEAWLSRQAPEPDPDECPACADMRLTVAELESQLVELADRLTSAERQRHADKRKASLKPR